MENRSSFDLNLAIQRWRENLAQAPTIRQESLDELESHLRESLMALQRSGLSPEEAFIIASRRMGPGVALEEEFVKVRPPYRRSLSLPHYVGVALILIVLLYIVVAVVPLTPRGLDAAIPQPPPPGTAPGK